MPKSLPVPTPAKRARELHRSSLVCDLHCDSILSKRDLALRWGTDHLDIPRMDEAGVKTQVFAIWSDPKRLKPGEYEDHVASGIERMNDLCRRVPARIAPCRSPEELDQITGSGRIAAILGVEGGHALEGRLERIEGWWQQGVRLLTITWCNSNELADGGMDENQPHAGLSDLGRDTVRRMNRLGMIVDVSHCSDRAFFQVLDITRAPVVASHSGVRSLRDFSRNLTDEMLRVLAENGGMIGMVFLPHFINSDEAKATVEDVVRGIDHIVQLVGPEHVGLGSDWDGFSKGPAGLEDVAKLPAVTEGLVRLGYPDDGIRLVLGLNFRRVWQDVIAAARAA